MGVERRNEKSIEERGIKKGRNERK